MLQNGYGLTRSASLSSTSRSCAGRCGFFARMNSAISNAAASHAGRVQPCRVAAILCTQSAMSAEQSPTGSRMANASRAETGVNVTLPSASNQNP